MSRSDTASARERLTVDVADLLGRLPEMGRLMVTANRMGATHERIGHIESVRFDAGWANLAGAGHDSRVALDAIAGIVVDRTSVMRDKVYPRIELLRADGRTLCSIVGFEGPEPFDAALAAFGPGEPLDPAEAETPAERGEVAPNDAGLAPFESAARQGGAVVIALSLDGFEQVWKGHIEAVKPAMGFINVMRPDFHLHLKANAVARWSEEGPRLCAQDAAGHALGLSIAPQR